MPETVYTYPLSDFPEGVCLPGDLDTEIRAAAGITKVHRGVAILGENVDIVFADELTQAEKDILDGGVSAPAGGLIAANYTLAKAKSLKIAEMSVFVNVYVYKHYEQHRQTSFNAMMIEAVQEEWLNRYAYIQTGLAWVKKVISHYYVLAYMINQQPSFAAVAAFTWDLESLFDSGPDGDPAITIYGASTQIELPRITSALVAAGTVLVPIANYSIVGMSAPRAPTSYNATGLPAGLVVDTATGVISGTPGALTAGVHNIEISATNAAGTDTKTLVLTIGV
jgi:hypothetical protein